MLSEHLVMKRITADIVRVYTCIIRILYSITPYLHVGPLIYYYVHVFLTADIDEKKET